MTPLDLVYLVAAGVTAPRWRSKNRSGWPERFGKGEALPPPHRPRILLHGVSVGETNALASIVPLLLERGLEVVVSASTDTGLARAQELHGSRCHVVRYPLDASWAVRRFLDRVQPSAVGLLELELWPQFLAACQKRSIPCAVFNGRLSERSFRGYRRLRFAVGPSFRRLAFAAVQDEAYAERFRAMGTNRIEVTGSMKWDAIPAGTPLGDADGGASASEPGRADALAAALGIDRSRPLIVAASTAEGEEALLHRACPPGVQLLCAPRQVQRFDEAAAALPGCRRRSDALAGDASSGRFLLDTIGELQVAFALADLVVIGRSFGVLHGSNPGEPASCGRAMVAGPRMGDFAMMAEALEAAGALVRVEAGGLAATLGGLMASPDERRRMGAAALGCVRQHRGASDRNAELLAGLLRQR